MGPFYRDQATRQVPEIPAELEELLARSERAYLAGVPAAIAALKSGIMLAEQITEQAREPGGEKGRAVSSRRKGIARR